MNTRLLIKVIIGLVVTALVGTPSYAQNKGSTVSPDALGHYRNGWLKHLGTPTGKPDWEKKAAAKAAAEFQKAIEIEPENVMFWQSLAFAFQKLGKTAEAEQQYKEAINLGSKDSFLHFALGRLYAKDKTTTDKAVNEFRIAIQQNPDEALFHYDLAHLLYMKAGGYDRKLAREAFKEVRVGNKKGQFTQYMAPYPKDFSTKMDYLAIITLSAQETMPELSMMRALAKENMALGKLCEKQGSVEKALRVHQANFIMGKKFAGQKPLAMMKMLVGVAIDSMALHALEELYSAQGMQEEVQWAQRGKKKLKEIQKLSNKKAAEMSKYATASWTKEEKELKKKGKDLLFLEAPFVREMLKIWPK